MKKLSILFIGALAALLSLAPVAGAHGKRHALTVCGIVDATSALPASLVLATGGTKLVTIANTNNVVLDAGIVAGADVCAKAKVVRTAPPVATTRSRKSAAKSLLLVSAMVRPAAQVEARGAITLGAGQITVATLVFTFPDGFTLSPKITGGKVVKALGSSATAGGPIVLMRVKRNGHHGHHARHSAMATASAKIAGRVSGLTAATATDPGSITVGGITLVIPAGTVLRSEVTDGAFVAAKAVVTAGVLTLKKVKVLSAAVTTAPAV